MMARHNINKILSLLAPKEKKMAKAIAMPMSAVECQLEKKGIKTK